jgi:hypothetical protein
LAELDVMLLARALLVLEIVGVAIAPGATFAK